MRRETKHDQPVHLLQSAQLYLPLRADLLQPAKALFDQPAAAQTNLIAELSRPSPVQIAGSVLVVLPYMRRHVQFTHRGYEILALVGPVGAHCNAPRAALLLVVEHQQRHIALGVAISVSHHRSSNQHVAVFYQCMVQIAQRRLLTLALLVQPRIRIGHGCMHLVVPHLSVEVFSIVII
jgi:hypothetical protein